jgi:3,4-dihydroxy 2-butanone 4-phosphate synthase/GTP cyclohydrolase II
MPPVAVICEVLHDDGSPARFSYLELFAQEHRVAMISVEQVVEYREASEGAGAASRPLLL